MVEAADLNEIVKQKEKENIKLQKNLSTALLVLRLIGSDNNSTEPLIVDLCNAFVRKIEADMEK